MFKWKRKSFFNYDLESKEIVIPVPIKQEDAKKVKQKKKVKHDDIGDEFERFTNCTVENFAFDSFQKPDKSDKIRKLLGFKVKRSGNNSGSTGSSGQKPSISAKSVNNYDRVNSVITPPKIVNSNNKLNSIVGANATKSILNSIGGNAKLLETRKDDKTISLRSVSKAKGLAAFGKVNKKYINEEGHFACTLCPYVSQYTTRFEIHMKQNHPQVSIFRCGICEYETRSKSYLTVHMMNHFGLKPFKCNQCDYASPRKDYLHLHMRSHSKIHTFKCALCNYTTYRKDYLHRHKAEKHRKMTIEDIMELVD